MYKLFTIKILILLFSFSGFNANASTIFLSRSLEKIELVENACSNFSDTFEIISLYTSKHKKKSDSLFQFFKFTSYQIQIDHQPILFISIKIGLVRINIVSHQINLIPQ